MDRGRLKNFGNEITHLHSHVENHNFVCNLFGTIWWDEGGMEGSKFENFRNCRYLVSEIHDLRPKFSISAKLTDLNQLLYKRVNTNGFRLTNESNFRLTRNPVRTINALWHLTRHDAVVPYGAIIAFYLITFRSNTRRSETNFRIRTYSYTSHT